MKLATLLFAVAAEMAAGSKFRNSMQDSAVGTRLRIGFFAESVPPIQKYDPETKTHSGGIKNLEKKVLEDVMGIEIEHVNGGVPSARGGRRRGRARRGRAPTGMAPRAPQVSLGDTQNYSARVVDAFKNDEIDAITGSNFPGNHWHDNPGIQVTESLLDLRYKAAIKKRLNRNQSSGESYASIWRPFSYELWVAIAGTIFYIALVLWLLERLNPHRPPAAAEDAQADKGPVDDDVEGDRGVPVGRGRWWQRCNLGKDRAYVYHAATLVLNNDETEYSPGTPASLFFRLVITFMGVILSATYTANLAAFFTYEEIIIEGPTTLSELEMSHACIFTGSNWEAWEDSIVKTAHRFNTGNKTTRLNEMMDICEDLLDDGNVSVILADWATMKQLELDNCESRVVLNMPLPSASAGIVMTTKWEALAKNISKAIIEERMSIDYIESINSDFRADKSCLEKTSNEGKPPSIQLDRMRGLFLIVAIAGALALAVAYLERIHATDCQRSCTFE